MGVEAPAPEALHPHIQSVLFTEGQIRSRVRELGEAISRDYAGKELLVIGVLRGATLFVADLLRELRVPAVLDFISISSYGAQTRSSGVVRIVKDLEEALEGRHVLIVEDVIDTGLTVNYLADLLRDRRAESLEVAALLDKPAARKVPCSARYIGFTVPNEFVVGYGLDYAQQYRGLPYIGILKREVYQRDGTANEPESGQACAQ